MYIQWTGVYLKNVLVCLADRYTIIKPVDNPRGWWYLKNRISLWICSSYNFTKHTHIRWSRRKIRFENLDLEIGPLLVAQANETRRALAGFARHGRDRDSPICVRSRVATAEGRPVYASRGQLIQAAILSGVLRRTAYHGVQKSVRFALT